jgi:hypothetical protein
MNLRRQECSLLRLQKGAERMLCCNTPCGNSARLHIVEGELDDTGTVKEAKIYRGRSYCSETCLIAHGRFEEYMSNERDRLSQMSLTDAVRALNR